MSLVSHPNVVNCIAAKISDKTDEGMLILNYFENGSLENMINTKALSSWTIKKIFILARGIAYGMSYISSCGIIHRDLKPANILIAKDYTPLISDYGVSRTINLLEGRELAMTLGVGSPIYMCPELLQESTKTYGSEVDVYSYGIILWQLLTKRMPYYDTKFNIITAFVEAVISGKRPTIDTTLKSAYNGLIEKCWSKNGNERPKFDVIIVSLNEFISAAPGG